MNVGKAFEQCFRDSCPKDVFLLRLKDTQWGKNPCDFISYKKPIMHLLELKTTKGKSLPFKNIAPHQLESLNRVWEVEGVEGYFIINFRGVNETYAVDGRRMYKYFHDTSHGRQSYPLDWVRENGIKLKQTKKRTRYRYEYTFIRE